MGGGRGIQPGDTGVGVGAAPVAALGEYDALKAQAQTVRTQLQHVNERLMEQQSGVARSPLVALVNAEKCIGCGICIRSCPAEAIQMDEIALVNREICNGCGICVVDCPQEAVFLQKRQLFRK